MALDFGLMFSFRNPPFRRVPWEELYASELALAADAERLGYDHVWLTEHHFVEDGYSASLLPIAAAIAARTERIRIAPNVLNLPLRQPAVTAVAAASLDLLSGGRFELSLGAGGFWDAIESMGTARLTPAESVVALEEAIDVIRGKWDTSERGGLFTDGEFHRLRGAKRGPRPAHDIPIHIGALKPRMLRLVGRKADGWLPSLTYLQPGDLAKANTIIDEAAAGAGRDPREIRRMLNIGAGPSGSAPWANELAEMTVVHGVSTFIVLGDDPNVLAHFGQEVAPAVRELVNAERASG